MGQPLYNRGVVNAMLSAEAIRTAMGKFGNKALTGEQVRWGFENLNLTEQRLDQLGMKGFTHAGEGRPARTTRATAPCSSSSGTARSGTSCPEWIAPMRDVVRPKIEAAAIEEGKKLSYTDARLLEGEVSG